MSDSKQILDQAGEHGWLYAAILALGSILTGWWTRRAKKDDSRSEFEERLMSRDERLTQRLEAAERRAHEETMKNARLTYEFNAVAGAWNSLIDDPEVSENPRFAHLRPVKPKVNGSTKEIEKL